MSFMVPWAKTPWNEITPGLYQGGSIYETDGRTYDVVVGYEFGLVVSLYKGWSNGPADGIPELFCQIPDGELDDGQLAAVSAVVPRIVAALHGGRKVLVRCAAGYNRSGLMVALVLLAMGKAADEAVELIREKRSRHALCNAAFVEYIRAAAAEVTVA